MWNLHKILLLSVRAADHSFELHPIQIKIIRSTPLYHVSYEMQLVQQMNAKQ